MKGVWCRWVFGAWFHNGVHRILDLVKSGLHGG